MEQFRILQEYNEFGEPINSFAVTNDKTGQIITWFDSFDEAKEWVDNHGEMAIENN